MINKVILVGNVGVDPEIRTLDSGIKVARVRLATGERFRDKQTQEIKEHTEWHTITLWRNMADVVDKYVRKGSQIYVEGRLRTNEWTDKEGNKRYSTEVVADDLQLLGRRPEGGAPSPIDGTSYGSGGAGFTSVPTPQMGSASPSAPQTTVPLIDDIDDLPF